MSVAGAESSPNAPAFGAGGRAILPVTVPPCQRGSRDHCFLKSQDLKLLFVTLIGLGEFDNFLESEPFNGAPHILQKAFTPGVKAFKIEIN